MSAFTPIASKHWKRSETTRCASSGHAFALGDDWTVPSAGALPFLICRREWRDVPVNHSRPRRVASFQSRLLPLGNKPGQMWTVSTGNFAGFLALGGFAWRKK
jgi:hypothetical protein